MTIHQPRYRASRRTFLLGTGAVAAGLSFLPRQSVGDEEKKLNFYNWDTYIGEHTLSDFEKTTGIATKMDLYADNDELFAKLKADNPGYDVIVPTNDTLERMIKANMVIEIDHSKIPNMANIDQPFKDATFDVFLFPHSLGLMEAAFVLAMVARDLRLRTLSGTHVVPEPMLSLRVRGGLSLPRQGQRGRMAISDQARARDRREAAATFGELIARAQRHRRLAR